METDGPDGWRVEHHKNGRGDYERVEAVRGNGKVIREKAAAKNAEERVSHSYENSSGSYNLLFDNCQHASDRAYRAADPPWSCMIL